MGVPSSVFREGRDVYYRYDWENIVFRWDPASRKTYQKFRGKAETETPPGSRLDADAQLGGIEISREEYEAF